MLVRRAAAERFLGMGRSHFRYLVYKVVLEQYTKHDDIARIQSLGGRREKVKIMYGEVDGVAVQ